MKNLRILLIMTVISFGYLFPGEELPQTTLASYSNKITGMVHSVSGKNYVLTLQFDQDPICYYAPLSFEESKESQYKRYFLPRTRAANDFIEDAIVKMNKSEGLFEKYIEIHKVTGDYPGLEILISTVSDYGKIEKIINHDDRLIYFKIK